MKVHVKRLAGDKLVEVFPSESQLSNLKFDSVYIADVKLERNYQFLKKFFALVKVGHNNTKLNMPLEAYRGYVTMKAGYAEIYKTPKGTMVLPKSISFGKMPEEEFAELYSRVLDVIIEDIGADKEVIEKQLLTFI